MMMEASRTSETLVDIQLRTWQYIPEDSELYTHHRENVKSHICIYSLMLFSNSNYTVSNERTMYERWNGKDVEEVVVT
jgi:hypothetical protein